MLQAAKGCGGKLFFLKNIANPSFQTNFSRISTCIHHPYLKRQKESMRIISV